MSLLKGFKHFLKEYRIIALSTAFVIGMEALHFIQSMVNDLILPAIRPLVSRTEVWENIILPIGPINFRIGSFFSATLSLLIVLLFLYLFIDKILRWKTKR